jgi:hypothetical protein
MTDVDHSSKPGPSQTLVILRGIGGAIAGAVIGYIAFRLLLGARFYGIMLPGVLLGWGAGLAARGKSQVLGIICGVLAVGVTLFAEWHCLFAKNHTFPDFLANVHTLDWQTLALMLLGVAAAWWFGQGR